MEKPLFYSSDREISSVTSIGRVRAKSIGEAVIYAFLVNGEAAECKVYVLSEEDYTRYLEAGSLEGILDDNQNGDDPDEPENPDDEQDTEVTVTPTPEITSQPEATAVPTGTVQD